LTTAPVSTTLKRVSSPGPLEMTSATVQDTLDAGEALGRKLLKEHPEGIVVLLIGPLGAGKTVLAKGIARALGVTEQIVSPTYTIVSTYGSGRVPLTHIDLYRIEGSDQAENLGLEDILRGSGIVLIEWGEKLESTLGLDIPHVRVGITLRDDGARAIEVDEVTP
jgi:tRNA threonylcarbamoyladenosine biosynthesis protein TsaE